MKARTQVSGRKGGTDLSIPSAPSARRSISAAGNHKPAPRSVHGSLLAADPSQTPARPQTPDVLAPPAAHRVASPLTPPPPGETKACGSRQLPRVKPSCHQEKDGPCWHKRRITIPCGFALASDARFPARLGVSSFERGAGGTGVWGCSRFRWGITPRNERQDNIGGVCDARADTALGWRPSAETALRPLPPSPPIPSHPKLLFPSHIISKRRDNPHVQ